MILVGEMRDLETISTALTAAETGHLVFATLHTQSTAQTVDRIIDVFPPHQQQQVRMQLSIALQGIVTQQLLPTADGSGRIVACEVLVPTPAIRNLIREGKTHQIYSALQTSGAMGMQTMDAHLAQLVRGGKITRTLAEQRASVPEELKRLLGGAASEPRPGGRGVIGGGAGDEHVRVSRGGPGRRAGARRDGGLLEGGGVRAAAPAGPDRPRHLREARGDEARERPPALQERQPARPVRLLAPVRDPDRLGDADAALALHARGADGGRDAREGDHRVREDVEAGSSVAQAMESQPGVFDPLYRSVVRAGEDSGRLDEALDRVAYQLERLDALQRQVRSAMTYPAVVFGLALIVMIVVVAVIVPVFVDIFKEIAADNPTEDTSLPLMTQITVGVSGFVTHHWYLLIVGGAAAAYGFLRWKKTDRGRHQWDRMKLRLPRVGDVVQKVALARWSRTFSGMVASGVPILQAIEIAGETSGNTWSRRRWTTSTPRSSGAGPSPSRSASTTYSRRWSSTWSRWARSRASSRRC